LRIFSVFQPRYAPRRARLRISKISVTRTVTSAAVLAALALVCGPALESTGEPAAAAAAALRAPDQPAGSTAATTEPATGWDGALSIRPSRFANAPAAGVRDAALVQPAPAGPPGEVGALGIPLMVLQAYHSAANRLGQDEPSCKLPWWLLAGIGHTESGHAESGRLTADGTTRGRILGPRLNGGIAGDAVITDTDHGALDGDTVYDRAVGPMQFIPSTWRTWGVDGNRDGKADPNNIFDATLAAGRYLCADGRDLSTPAGRQAAVLSYNYSATYLATVLAWGEAYRDGAAGVPDSPLPVVSDVTKVRPPRSARPPKPVAKPSTSPSGTPSGPVTSTHPTPSGSGSTSSSSAASDTSSASATPSCSTTSPAPTDSASTSVPVQSASGESHAAPQGSATGSATADGSATGSASTSRSQTATAAGSTGQSSAGQSGAGQESTGQSSPEESSSASTSAPPSCAP
jgi:membrane-bound lytic murein transglycosylase B